jgi:hypothetical protein
MVYPEQWQQQDEWARQYAHQVFPEQQQQQQQRSQQQHSAFTYQHPPQIFLVQQPQQQQNAWGHHLAPSPPHNTGTSAAWARQYAPHVIPKQQRQNPWSHQCAPHVSTEQQQQPRAVYGSYAQQPSPNMGINTPTPSPATYSNDYFYGEGYLNLGQHSYYNGQTVPTMPATFAPQLQNNVTQRNFIAAPPPDQGLTAPALDPHPSDIVNSLSQAMNQTPPQDWHCPKDDATLPATDEDRERWVQMLLNAMNNLDGIEGNQGRKNQNSLQKRWRGPLTGPDYYLPVDKLILCWTIEDLAERLHRLGPSVFHSFDANFWHQAAKTRNWTFEDRMTWIIELLRVSKTRCDSLLGGSGLQGIVANPAEKLDATRAQAKQNEKRGETLKLGRAIKKQKTDRVT